MTLLGVLADQLGRASTWSIVTALGLAVASCWALAIVGNVLWQLLRKNPNEPPVVFHWAPLIGSTIEYGMDPYKFFFKCREKVCAIPIDIEEGLKLRRG